MTIAGLIAGCGNQAIERRARGAAYAGPSPYLVFVTIIAATNALAAPVALFLRFAIGSTDVAGLTVTVDEAGTLFAAYVAEGHEPGSGHHRDDLPV